MKKTILLLIIFFNILPGLTLASKLSRIELNDGNIIIGEISNFNNGIYSIASDGMGQLKIEESRIKQISSANSNQITTPTEPLANTLSSENINALANKMMSDKETVGMIASLQNDPQFQAIINDPEIINAVKSGDSASLMSNEKFMQLKDNPTIQKISKKTSQ